MKRGILVIGSSNTDMVIKADHLPLPGETILGGTFFMNPGGKGANQAVAAARLGGEVTFICKTGNDIFGQQSLKLFKDEGMNTDFLLSDAGNPSGVALITVDRQAENCIVVASGANATLVPEDLLAAGGAIEQAGIVLLQQEIPLQTVAYLAAKAFAAGAIVILNPAPASELADSLLANLSIITPNETEAAILSGIKVTDIDSAKLAAMALKNKGVKSVIITLGSMGVLVFHEDVFTHVEALKVAAVDTTAAGDVFNGAFAVAISEGQSLVEAAAFACRASAISVTRLGAQASAPYRREMDEFFLTTENNQK